MYTACIFKSEVESWDVQNGMPQRGLISGDLYLSIFLVFLIRVA